MKNIRSITCAVVIGLTLIAQMMSPVLAYADGEATPEPTATSEATSTPEPTETTPTEVIPSETPTSDPSQTTSTASPSPTDVPVETGTPLPSTDIPEATATPEPAEATVLPIDTGSPIPEQPTDTIDTTVSTPEPVETTAPVDANVVEDPTLLEVVQEVPSDTSIVVLDENGQPLSLASQDAAAIIENSDPMWCPIGITPGGIGCTASYATVTDLINFGAMSGSGTIYFTPFYFTNDATFDHNNPSLFDLTDLTIQGGWNGSTGASYALSGNSVFTVPLSIINWTGNVTVNNLTIIGTTDTGLNVITTGTINAKDITSNSNGYAGAFFRGTNGVTLTGTNTFNNNGSHGFFASSPGGQVVVNNVTANNNIIGWGAILDDGKFGVTLNGATLTGNGGGLTAGSSSGFITLNNVTASNNWYSYGATLYSTGDVTLTGTNVFNGNGYAGEGLLINSSGNITLNNVTATGNRYMGANLNNTGGTGNITLTGTNTFNNNGLPTGNHGLKIVSFGNINLANVTANNNGFYGVELDCWGALGSATLSGSKIFNNNRDSGLFANCSSANVTLNGSTTANNNLHYGVWINGKDVTLTGNSVFNINPYGGLVVYSSGNITLQNITAIGDPGNPDGTWDGAHLINNSGTGNVTVTGINDFSHHSQWASGMYILSNGNVNLDGITSNNNGRGVNISQAGNVTISNSTFNNNSYAYDGVYVANTTGNITLDNITANNNGNGASLDNTSGAGNVTINNSFFSGNSWYGAYISSNAADITNSVFSQNYIGAAINSNGDANISQSNFDFNEYDGFRVFTNGGAIDIQDSTFNNNNQNGCDGYGAWLNGAGNIAVNNSAFNQNFAGLVYYPSNDINVDNSEFLSNYIGIGYNSFNSLNLQNVSFLGNLYDTLDMSTFPYSGGCNNAPLPLVAPPQLSVSVQNQGTFTLDCAGDQTDGYSRSLPNGDLVEIFCPVSGEASIERFDSTTLPGDLPDGYTYASGFEVQIKQNDKPITVIEEGGYIRSSFLASYLQPGNSYEILYWDAWEIKDGKWEPLESGKWVPLKDFMLNGNAARSFFLDPETENFVERKIIRGVQLLTSHTDKRVDVTVNFPGIFVLAQH